MGCASVRVYMLARVCACVQACFACMHTLHEHAPRGRAGACARRHTASCSRTPRPSCTRGSGPAVHVPAAVVACTCGPAGSRMARHGAWPPAAITAGGAPGRRPSARARGACTRAQQAPRWSSPGPGCFCQPACSSGRALVGRPGCQHGGEWGDLVRRCRGHACMRAWLRASACGSRAGQCGARSARWLRCRARAAHWPSSWSWFGAPRRARRGALGRGRISTTLS